MTAKIHLSALMAILFIVIPLRAQAQAHAETKEDPYYFIRNTDLSEFPVKLRAKYHRELTLLLVQMEKGEKYPKYAPSLFSSINILDFFKNTLVNECMAADDANANICLFGGWLSRRAGSCQRPWGSSAKAASESMDVPSYNSDYYCGADNLFRCNPLMFGPGLDQELVGSEYQNVNGKKNNSEPFDRGICVDVSRGYNGLSERCQQASEKLDEVRVAKGMAPWREGKFFDDQKTNDFKNLQSIVANKCATDGKRLNSDNMCDSLNKSLGMTASAVLAGKVDGVSPKQLFPQCTNIESKTLPRCNDNVHASFNPMIEAMEELREKKQCSFMGIQAIDDDSLTNSFEAPKPECRSTVAGALKSSGFSGDGEQGFSFYFVGSKNQQLGRIHMKVSPGMSKEAIMAMLSSGENQKDFEKFCTKSACPQSENPTLKNLYGALEKLKQKDNCSLGRVQAVDYETGSTGIFEYSQCGLSIEGDLGSEGFQRVSAKSGVKAHKRKVSINLRDKKGEFLTTVHVDISAGTTTDQILAQIPKEEIQAACVRSNTTDRTDSDAAVADLGISNKTFIPSYWKDKLDDIRNILESQNPPVEGVRVEVTADGSLKIFSKDKMDILAQQTMLSNTLDAGRKDGLRVSFTTSDSMDYVLVGNAPSSVSVESISHRKGVNLSSEQRSILEEVGTEQALSDFNVNKNGAISFTSTESDRSGALFSNGEKYRGYEVLVVSETKRKAQGSSVEEVTREYSLTPLAEDGSTIEDAPKRTPTSAR